MLLLVPRLGYLSPASTFHTSTRSPSAISSLSYQLVSNLSSCCMPPPSQSLSFSRASCLPLAYSSPHHGTHPHPHLCLSGTEFGINSRLSLPHLLRSTLTIRSAHMSTLAWGDYITLIATARHKTRLILRHLNVSTLLLLLDRRRCAGNPEEGEKAPGPSTTAVRFPRASCVLSKVPCTQFCAGVEADRPRSHISLNCRLKCLAVLSWLIHATQS